MKHGRDVCLALAVSAAAYGGVATSRAANPSQVPTTPEQQARRIPPVTVTCSSDKPTVWPREEISVRAFVTGATSPLRFTWTATAGRIAPREAEARWNFTGVAAGTYAATVRLTDDAGASVDCVVRAIVQPRSGDRGRESGWSFLVSGRNEEQRYGLYSYLLLGSPPTDATRERYRKTIEAYVRLIPDVVSLELYLPRRELNITYVPIRIAPPTTRIGPDWVLEHYDYARARILLSKLSGDHREGPYIVSSLLPLTTATALSGQYLFQNLSRTPSHLASLWAREFFNQAAQERFWQEETTVRGLALKLRTTLAILASGLPDVRIGVDDRIAWIR